MDFYDLSNLVTCMATREASLHELQPLRPQVDVKICWSRGQGISYSGNVMTQVRFITMSVGPPSEGGRTGYSNWPAARSSKVVGSIPTLAIMGAERLNLEALLLFQVASRTGLPTNLSSPRLSCCYSPGWEQLGTDRRRTPVKDAAQLFMLQGRRVAFLSPSSGRNPVLFLSAAHYSAKVDCAQY